MCRVDKSSHHELIISTEPRHVHIQQNSTTTIMIHLDMHTQQNLITKYDTCNNKQLAESEHYQHSFSLEGGMLGHFFDSSHQSKFDKLVLT